MKKYCGLCIPCSRRRLIELDLNAKNENDNDEVRFKFRSQLKLLSQIICLLALRVEASVILDSSITDNIIRRVINV